MASSKIIKLEWGGQGEKVPSPIQLARFLVKPPRRSNYTLLHGRAETDNGGIRFDDGSSIYDLVNFWRLIS